MPEECIFGPNIICQDWSMVKTTDQTFSLNLKLKNNLERTIEPYNFTIYNDEGVEISCEFRDMYCPYDSTSANWSATGYNKVLLDNDDSSWSVGMVCRLEASNCEKKIFGTSKEPVRASFGFKRKDGINIYELNAKILVKPIV